MTRNRAITTKRGLLVRDSSDVVRRERRSVKHRKALPAAWYIWVQYYNPNKKAAEWQAVEQLRFVRKIDAERAAKALTAVGLDSTLAMKKAGAETVLCTAFEALQW